MSRIRSSSLLYTLLLFVLGGCTSVTIDEMRWEETSIDPSADAVVVLGRHHSPDYETEPELVDCVAQNLRRNIDGLSVVPATEFTNRLYPWFEPRSAPLNINKFLRILEEPLIRSEIESLNIKYMVWIEGATETTSQAGSMSCAIGPGGGGCFGFGTWENESDYEASIWDFRNTREAGRISTDAKGTSYMPAIIIPIPLLAQVQTNACDGLGKQLSAFFEPAGRG